jgi:hypothetical protein
VKDLEKKNLPWRNRVEWSKKRRRREKEERRERALSTVMGPRDRNVAAAATTPTTAEGE